MKEVLLLGLGGIGGVYALVLHQSKQVHLTVVARSNFNAVQQEGMTFRSDRFGDHVKGWRPDRLFSTVAEAADRAYDYVIVATKVVPEVMPTERMLAPLLSKEYTQKWGQPIYVLLQNGIGVERGLYDSIKNVEAELSTSGNAVNVPARIISACVYTMGNLAGPNVVEYVEGYRLTVGIFRPDSFTVTQNNEEETQLLSDFKTLMEAGGTSIAVVPEIQRRKLQKNMLNLGFATLGTLANHPAQALFRPPPENKEYELYRYPATAHLIEEYTLPNIVAVFKEVIALGRALGFPDSDEGLPSDLPTKSLEYVRKNHMDPKNNHHPSMLLDMRLGKPIEVEVIVGEVVRMARRVGVDMPRIEMLYGILLVVQNQILKKIAEEKAPASGRL